jgi:hypothetical protein
MTAADLIKGSFRVLGILEPGESLEASMQADAFAALNDMVDGWANERLTLFSNARSTYTLTPGLNPHTIGVGGTFNVERPMAVDRASIVPSTAAGTERPLALLSEAEWQGLQGKTSAGSPFSMWYQTTYPLGRLWLNPVPDAADTLVLYVLAQLGRFASVSATVDLPPGYTRALKYNLAKELAPEYGVKLSAEAADIANESKADLKRINNRPSYLRSDSALLRGGTFSLASGDK